MYLQCLPHSCRETGLYPPAYKLRASPRGYPFCNRQQPHELRTRFANRLLGWVMVYVCIKINSAFWRKWRDKSEPRDEPLLSIYLGAVKCQGWDKERPVATGQRCSQGWGGQQNAAIGWKLQPRINYCTELCAARARCWYLMVDCLCYAVGSAVL